MDQEPLKDSQELSPDRACKRLEEHYRAQKELYTQLLKLSKEQLELLQKGDGEAVGATLQRKNAIIQEVKGSEEELTSLKEEWTRLEAQLPEAKREELRVLVEELRGLITAVLEKDEEGSLLLREWMEETTSQLQRFREAKSAVRAYQSQTRDADDTTTPVFFDKKE